MQRSDTPDRHSAAAIGALLLTTDADLAEFAARHDGAANLSVQDLAKLRDLLEAIGGVLAGDDREELQRTAAACIHGDEHGTREPARAQGRFIEAARPPKRSVPEQPKADVLPFTSGSARPSTTGADLGVAAGGMSLEQYASFCAERGDAALERGWVRARYGIASQRQEAALHQQWQTRFRQRPRLLHQWQQLLMTYRSWLRAQKSPAGELRVG